MIYQTSKFLVFIALKFFFKKIKIRGLENITSNEPVLIAANHTNAFMDAIALQVHTFQAIHTLARGDVFKNKIAKWFLNRIKVNPIYRLQEGTENLHKNKATFELCNALFKNKKNVMIFPEGVCIQERRLCKLKKGTGRIVFGAEEAFDFKLGLKVVPVGINYSTPSKFGGTLMINIDKPIEVAKYIEYYKIDKARTINTFTKDLEKKMQRLIVEIENRDNDVFIEQIEKLYKTKLLNELEKKKKNLLSEFVISKHIAKAISKLEKHESEKFVALKSSIESYHKNITAKKMSDHFLAEGKFHSANKLNLFIKIVTLFSLFPIHLVGLIFNYLPFKLPHLLAKKIVKHIEFFTSINVGFGTFIFLLYYTILCTLGVLLIDNLYVIPLILILAPTTGIISLKWWHLFRDVQKITIILKSYPLAKKLSIERAKIIQELDKTKKWYFSKTWS